MKRLLALALFILPVAAHANNRAPIGIEPVRQQIKTYAQQNGFLTKGSGETLRVSKPVDGAVKVTILTKGGGLPGMPQGLHPMATASFKLAQEVDGAIATPVKNADGQVFERMLFMRSAK